MMVLDPVTESAHRNRSSADLLWRPQDPSDDARLMRTTQRGVVVAHIQLPPGLPGISSAFAYRPDTAKPLRELAEVLLRGPNTLTSGERETIAAFVSTRNDCAFCDASHRSAAAHNLGGDYGLVDAVREDYMTAPISSKLKALLTIAARVQVSGKSVTSADVEMARDEGATDDEIHDTVLIAAAFCMFNRYVDGLDAWTPTDPDIYDEMGQRMAREGYVRPPHQASPSDS